MSSPLQEKIGELIAELHETKSRVAVIERERDRALAKADNTKKLAPFQVGQIRRLHASGMSQREIADHYTLNSGTVSRIVRGIYYKKVV